MKLSNLLWGAAMAAALTGCVDSNYDLADIDSTSEFKVNDLILPLNLAPVELQDIIHLDSLGKIQETTINGKTFYAVIENGDISAKPLDLKEVTSTPDPLSPSVATFALSSSRQVAKRQAGTLTATYTLRESIDRDVVYTDNNVDGAVKELTVLNFKPLHFTLNITMADNTASVESYLRNIQLVIPAGLTVSSVTAPGYTFNPTEDYKPNTGILNIDNVNIVNKSAVIDIVATGVDISLPIYQEAAQKPFIYNTSSKSGEFHLNSKFIIKEGQLVFGVNTDNGNNIPSEIKFNVTYGLSRLEATSFLGAIQYDLEPTPIEPINLEDLPSFLADPETDLILANPQLYLNLQNPIAQYGLGYQASLDIEAKRENPEDSRQFPSPMVEVTKDEKGEVNYVLAANTSFISESDVPEEYRNNLHKLTYNNFGDIISGNGLPKSLEINVENAEVPFGKLTSPLPLGSQIEGMEGSYRFLAPLALRDDSKIVKVVDGWWSEDLEDLTIDYLTITADALNGLPTGVQLRVFAINQEGEQISSEASLTLPQGPDEKKINVTIEGPFNDLDGIKLYVVAKNNPALNLEPLGPDQTITLSNIQAKVSGKYCKKF